MPPQHPTGGDVLDQALHAARTQAAGKGAQGFFQALKPNSNQFAQTSRVNLARPATQLAQQSTVVPTPQERHPFLGGNGTTAATPAEQSFLARQNATNPNASKPIQQQAAKIEQTYVRADDTRHVIPAHGTHQGRASTGVQGAALSAPNIQTQGLRALGALGSHVPLGAAAPAALAALAKLNLTADARHQVIGGFAHDTTLDVPQTKAAEVALALAKGNSIPANPTKRQLLTAALSPHEHKPSYWDAVNPLNIAKDALYTPVYTAEGGFALGHAARAALPTSLGGSGNTNELKAIGESQLQQIEHPGAFIQQHPFQAALTALSIAKGVGAVGGKVAGLEAAPREVPATAFGDVPIPRPELSTNLTTRIGQNVSDFALGNSKRLQGKALQAETRKIANTVRIEQNHKLSAAMRPLADAAKGISRRRQASLLYNEAQGATAPEFAQMYRDLAKEHGLPTQDAQAKLRTAQGERFGPVNPKEQAFVDAARNAAQTRTQMLLGMKTPAGTAALDPLNAQWRDYQHLVGLRASQGDPLAQAVTEARTRSVATQIGTPEHAAASADLAKSLDAFAQQHLGGSKPVAPTEVPAGDQISLGESRRAGTFVTNGGAKLGPNDYVTLYHATSREGAANALRNGFELGKKVSKQPEPITDPTVAKMLGKNVGDVADYGIGRGQGRGTYLAPDAHDIQHYGDTVLAVRVRVGDLRVPPERGRAPSLQGPDGPVRSTLLGDGYVEGNIPAENVSLVSSPHQFTNGSGTPGQAPFRVPTTKPKLRSEFNYPGRSLRAKTDPRTMVSGLKNSTGAALESGNYPHDPANFYRELQQPHTAAAAIEYTNRVSKELGKPAIPGEPIPEGMMLRNVENLRTTPKTSITAADSLNHDATVLQQMQDEFKDPVVEDITNVPKDGKWLLIPRPVYDQIAENVARYAPKGLEHGISKLTKAYKTGVLMTRPAYPMSNFVNSMAQSALGGTGPLSFARRNAFPLPPGVEDAGFIASEFRKSGRLGFRSGLDQAAVTPGTLGKVEAIGKGVGRAASEQYLGRIRKWSIDADNVWRKAFAAKEIKGEARKLAYPDDGAVKRFFVRKKATDAAIQDYAKQIAEGSTPEAAAAQSRVLHKMNDFLNDFGAMKQYKTLDLAVPFNRWTRFSGTLLLKTLPLNYPGRTLLMYRLGQLGQQGTDQQGVLPSYLQESIPLAGSPAREWLTNTQRANSFATLGTTVPPVQTSGSPDLSQMLGNVSPFLPLVTNTLTGKDLQTGRQLSNAEGNPITENPLDQARYAASQIAAFLPPLAVSTGGTRGKADTSIPIGIPGTDINLTQNRKPNNKGPLLQQPQQPWWLPLVNAVAPIRIDVRNLHADQVNGANLLTTYLAKKQAADNKAALGKPGGQAAVVAKWTRIGDEVNANLQRYLKNPKLVDELLASGHAAGKAKG